MKKNFFIVFGGLFFALIIWVIGIYYFDILSSTIFKDRIYGINYFNKYYEFLLGLIIYIIIQLILFFWNRKYAFIWFVKGFLITLIFMMFYEYKYGGDPAYYADEALKNIVNFRFGESGTYNIIIINHFFTFLVGKSYYSLKVLNSFIGFLGILFIYKTYEYILNKLNLKINRYFIYILFFFPSILFWSSILGKDPLNLFFIGIFVYAFVHFIDSPKLKYLMLIVLSIWLVSYIRSWWSLIMMISIFLYFLKINNLKNFMFFSILTPIVIYLMILFLQKNGIDSIQALFIKMNYTMKNLSYGGSSVGVAKINNFFDYILWFVPNLFTALFRPMPWDIRNAFTALAAVENLVLLVLVYKYIIKNWKQIYSIKYIKFLILLIFSWALFYVIISPTNLGMAARFKLQVLPIMLIIIGVSYEIYRQKNSNLS